MRRAAALLVLAAGCATAASGCGQSDDTLTLFFRDNMVEYPARSIDVLTLSGATCDALLAELHETAATDARVLTRRTGRYAPGTSASVLGHIPRGRAVAIDAAAYNGDMLQIARGCTVVNFAASSAQHVTLELRALPACTSTVTSLDVAVVLDTSVEMGTGDPANVHLDEFTQRILTPADALLVMPATWDIITHDTIDGVQEPAPPTSSPPVVQAALTTLTTRTHGAPRAYDAIYEAAGKLRARAVCGRRPVLITFLGDADGGSTRIQMDATNELRGAMDDPTDDIFTYGLGVSPSAFDTLNGLIPGTLGTAAGAMGDAQIRSHMDDIGSTLKGLIH